MDYKKSKSLRGLACLTLTAALLFGSLCVQAAEVQEESKEKEPVKLELTVYDGQGELDENVPMPYTMLINDVCFSSKEKGLCVDISTSVVGVASVLGTKDIELHEKNGLGWKTVGEADGYTVYNRASSGCSFVYEDAIYNWQYRVKCTHFGDVDGYEEDEQLTSAYTYNYKK